MQNQNRQSVKVSRAQEPEVREKPDNIAVFPSRIKNSSRSIQAAELPECGQLRVHAGKGLPVEYHFPEPVEVSAHFRQSVDWFECHADSHLVAATFVGDRLVARSVIRQCGKPGAFIRMYRVERGPLATDMASLKRHLQDLVEYFSTNRAILQVNPYTEDASEISELEIFLTDQGWVAIDHTRNFYRHSLTVDLKPNLESIRAGFRKSLRRNINKAGKAGLECRIDNCEVSTKKLIELYNTTAQMRGFEPLTSASQRFIHQSIKTGSMTVCAVLFEGEIVGGNLIVPFGQKVLLEWGAFSELPEHRKFPLAHLADWESIVWAREKGYLSLDFSGYWLERGDEDPINHYKSGFGKEVVAVMPEYDYSNLSAAVRFFLRAANYGRKFVFQARKLFH